MGFWCFFCLQRQLFVQNPHRVTILHLPVSSIITVSVHWGICVCAHLCFHVTVTVSVQFFLFLCLTSTLSNYRVLLWLVFFKLRVQFPQVWHLFLSQIHLCCLLFFNRHQVTPTVLFFSVSTHLPLSPRYYSKCVQYVFLYHVLDFPANTILKLVLKHLHFDFCPGLHKTDVEQQTVVMWLTELKGNFFLCDWMV